MKTLTVRTRAEWRAWLAAHHDSVSEIWLVFPKRHTGKTTLTYEDSIEEALCFGWVDSLVKRLDNDHFARKFTPRKLDSRWSTLNRRRYEKVKALGLLAPSGVERAPTVRSGDAPRPSLAVIPPYLEKALRANGRAWRNFEQLAPSYRRLYIAWVESAKRDETKQKRLREAVARLAAGQKLGLK